MNSQFTFFLCSLAVSSFDFYVALSPPVLLKIEGLVPEQVWSIATPMEVVVVLVVFCVEISIFFVTSYQSVPPGATWTRRV